VKEACSINVVSLSITALAFNGPFQEKQNIFQTTLQAKISLKYVKFGVLFRMHSSASMGAIW